MAESSTIPVVTDQVERDHEAIRTYLSSNDWEEQLRVARIAREKILAERARLRAEQEAQTSGAPDTPAIHPTGRLFGNLPGPLGAATPQLFPVKSRMNALSPPVHATPAQANAESGAPKLETPVAAADRVVSKAAQVGRAKLALAVAATANAGIAKDRTSIAGAPHGTGAGVSLADVRAADTKASRVRAAMVKSGVGRPVLAGLGIGIAAGLALVLIVQPLARVVWSGTAAFVPVAPPIKTSSAQTAATNLRLGQDGPKTIDTNRNQSATRAPAFIPYEPPGMAGPITAEDIAKAIRTAPDQPASLPRAMPPALASPGSSDFAARGIAGGIARPEITGIDEVVAASGTTPNLSAPAPEAGFALPTRASVLSFNPAKAQADRNAPDAVVAQTAAPASVTLLTVDPLQDSAVPDGTSPGHWPADSPAPYADMALSAPALSQKANPDLAPASPASVLLADAGSYHVNLHVADAGAGPQAQVMLAGLGFGEAVLQHSAFGATETTVVYYRAEDAALARTLARYLGGQMMDLTGFAPAPAARTLDIYLKG